MPFQFRPPRRADRPLVVWTSPETEARVAFSRRYPLQVRDYVKLIVRHEQWLERLVRDRQNAESMRVKFATNGNAVLEKVESKAVARMDDELAKARASLAAVCKHNPSLARRVRVDWAEES